MYSRAEIVNSEELKNWEVNHLQLHLLLDGLKFKCPDHDLRRFETKFRLEDLKLIILCQGVLAPRENESLEE